MLLTCSRYFLPLMALLIITGCEKPVDENSPEPSQIGMWHYALPPLYSITTDTLNIWLEVINDATYSLELIERDDKLLYSSKGTWEATTDSIFLTGNDCRILDTSTEPDSMVTLEDSLCEIPIPLEPPDEESTWTIETANLAAMMNAFPIPAELTSQIPIFFPEIPLEKESD